MDTIGMDTNPLVAAAEGNFSARRGQADDGENACFRPPCVYLFATR